jgi:hypothetical protein
MGTPHRLSKPIERRDFTIDEITIGEPNGETMLLLDEFGDRPMRLTMELIANMAEVDGKRGEIGFADVKRMNLEDIGALGELATEAFPDGLRTGRPPSVP